jgi:hypothetical protein
MRRISDELAARLREASAKRENLGKAAQLRPVMDDIEAAIASGLSYQAILGELASAGLVMSLATFKSILHRHRKRHGKTRNPPMPASMQKAVPGKVLPPVSGQDGIPQTGIDRINAIMRSTPDLAELARLAKAARKDKSS